MSQAFFNYRLKDIPGVGFGMRLGQRLISQVVMTKYYEARHRKQWEERERAQLARENQEHLDRWFALDSSHESAPEWTKDPGHPNWWHRTWDD